MHFVHSSFLGVTAHWIDASSFERKSCGLALQRLKGSHTGEILAERISNIIKEFNLSNKVVKIVTDNATNFEKAFKIRKPSVEFPNEDAENDFDSDDEIEFIDLLSELTECRNSSELVCILPPQKRCAAHSLNLAMTTDIEKRVNEENFVAMSRMTQSKCTALYSKQNQSSKAADFIHQKLGIYLRTPVSTRWNSYVDSYSFLLAVMEIKTSELNEIFDAFCLPKLTQPETEFLKEYVKVFINNN